MPEHKCENEHLRSLKSYPYQEHRLTDEFREFVRQHILPLVKLRGYKLEQKRSLVAHLIHNLVMTGLSEKVVCDGRRKDTSGVDLRVQVWEAIEEAGLARKCLGSELSGKRTRYQATTRLLSLQEEWKLRLLIDTHLARNTELTVPTPFGLVCLHTGKLNPITGRLLPKEQRKTPVSIIEHVRQKAQPGPDGKPDPRAVVNGLAYFRGIEDMIDVINSNNLKHGWMAYATDEAGQKRAFQPNACLRQIHAGEFFRAVRLYSFGPQSGQNLSKSQRRSMLIDGEPVAELDFSGMMPRMLYHLRAPKATPFGDVYQPEKIMPTFYGLENVSASGRATVRDFIKRATNICLNVAKEKKAHSAIGNLLQQHRKREFLRKVLRIERTNSGNLVDRILAAHPALNQWFFAEVGLELMTIEGRIMLRILHTLAQEGKPALGIHDSVVCKATDAKHVKEVMEESYNEVTGQWPEIKRLF